MFTCGKAGLKVFSNTSREDFFTYRAQTLMGRESYNLAFPNDNKIGVTAFCLCEEKYMKLACSRWLSCTYSIKSI